MSAAGTLAAAQQANAQTDRQRVDTTVNIDRGATLSVSVYTGRVSVTNGAGSQVRIQGYADRGELEIRARATGVSISSEPDGPHGSRAELDITVPVGTRVVLDGFSAPFSIRGVKGEAKVESLSGDVIVSDAVGKVSVETVSGNIDVDRVDGDVTTEAVSGRVSLTNIKGDIDTETVSGRLTMTGIQANSVRAESVAGSISYDGTFNETGNYVFKSHAGRLTLGLPANTGATVSLQTFSGNVDSDFPVTLEPANVKGAGHEVKFEFRIGNGRSRIVAETFSGNIRIMRGTTSQSRDQ
jgi:hypothetical protein